MRREVTGLNAILDVEIRGSLEALEGPPITCAKGCAGCCRQLTVATTAEAQNIVETHPELVRRALPVLRAQNAFLDHAAERLGLPPELSNETRQAFADAWWLAGQACVFLDAAGTCTIYRQRPLACRTYFVRSDPARCHDPEVGRDVEVVAPREILTGHRRLLEIAARHDQPAIGALPTVLLRAWRRH